MMSRDQWIGQIVDVAREIASREFQERAWFGIGPEVSSPDEMYNSLFEDNTFDLFLEKYAATLTPRQTKAWSDLRCKREEYDQQPEKLDPHRVINDPEWQNVRESAAHFVTAFETSKMESS